MPLQFRYSDPGGAEEPAVVVDLGNEVVRYAQFSVGHSAELGEAAVSGLIIDDPDGTLDLVGYRGFGIFETSAPSNSQRIFSGVIGDQHIRRGGSDRPSLRLGAARIWDIDLIDQNWSLSVSLITGEDGNRPAESAGTRLAWLLASDYARFADYGHVTYPTDPMDAADYRHQTAKDVLADVALPGGYNYWCERPEAQNRPELFFMDPDSADYASTISISNDLADVDSSTVFCPIDQEATLGRSPSRIAYGVDLQYAKGSVYLTDTTTGNQFAFVDRAAPLANVKSLAKATVIAARFLAENNEQDERVSCSIKVPAAQVNDLRHGHRTSAKFTHLPGWESGRDCRVLWRTVSQEAAGGDAWYRIDLELTPLAGALSCSAAILARTSATAVGLESPDPTASVTVSASDTGYVVGILMADNGNTPDATGMGTPTGYTNLDARDFSRATWFMGYKAVSAGSVGMSASWTPGFASSGVWAAGLAWLPWANLTVVQEDTADPGTGGGDMVLPASPTAGNTILMIATAQDLDAITWTLGGTYGPSTGWTELFSATTVVSGINSRAHVACWARCVAEGDGVDYGFSYDGLIPQQAFGYIVEIAT